MIEPGITRLCKICKGTGQETIHGRSDPSCVNCQWGDCDYGHDVKILCSACEGTGILPYDSQVDK